MEEGMALSRLGVIFDKLGQSLVVLDDKMRVNYSNPYLGSTLSQTELQGLLSSHRVVPGVFSRKKVFFLFDKDMTEQQEVWVKLQIQGCMN